MFVLAIAHAASASYDTQLGLRAAAGDAHRADAAIAGTQPARPARDADLLARGDVDDPVPLEGDLGVHGDVDIRDAVAVAHEHADRARMRGADNGAGLAGPRLRRGGV